MAKQVINVPAESLDMFAKHGVKSIVAGNTEYRLKKKPKKKRQK